MYNPDILDKALSIIDVDLSNGSHLLFGFNSLDHAQIFETIIVNSTIDKPLSINGYVVLGCKSFIKNDLVSD